MTHMDDALHQAAESVLEELRVAGSPLATLGMREETIARGWRRWTSFERRHSKDDRFDARVEDLAKGLVAVFEPDRNLVGWLITDYRHLALHLALVFRDYQATVETGPEKTYGA